MARQKRRPDKKDPTSRERPDRRNPRLIWLGLLIGLLTFAAYGNSFSGDLVLDSAVLIEQDPRLRDVTSENFAKILSKPYWWPSVESDLYRPVTTLTYLVNYAVFG